MNGNGDSNGMKFNDGGSQPSQMQQLQISHLSSKVDSLERTIAQWVDLIANAEKKMSELSLLANALSKNSFHQQIQFRKFDVGNSSFSSVCSTDHEIVSSTSLDPQRVECSLSEDREPALSHNQESGFPVSSLLHPELLRVMQANPLYEQAALDAMKELRRFDTTPRVRLINSLKMWVESIAPHQRVFDLSLPQCLALDEVRLLVTCDFGEVPSIEKSLQSFLSTFYGKKEPSPNNRSGASTSTSIGGSRSRRGGSKDIVTAVYNEQRKALTGSIEEMSFQIIGADESSELLMHLLLEDLNKFIGKNDLLKESIFLIRSWWTLESSVLVGISVRSYLPEMALLVMIVAVFNLYAAKIETPLQALAMFLAEYEQYNTSKVYITIYGQRSFDNKKNSDSNADEGKKLVDEALLGAYRQYAGMSTSSTTAAAIEQSFSKGTMIVINPFDGQNVVREPLTGNQMVRLMKLLQIGAKNMVVYLERLHDTGFSERELIMNYFPAVTMAIKEIPSHALASSSGVVPTAATSGNSKEMIHDAIQHCMMVFRGLISKDNLVALCKKVLLKHGSVRFSEVSAILLQTFTTQAKVNMDITLFPVHLFNIIIQEKEMFSVLDEYARDPYLVLKSAPGGVAASPTMQSIVGSSTGNNSSSSSSSSSSSKASSPKMMSMPANCTNSASATTAGRNNILMHGSRARGVSLAEMYGVPAIIPLTNNDFPPLQTVYRPQQPPQRYQQSPPAAVITMRRQIGSPPPSKLETHSYSSSSSSYDYYGQQQQQPQQQLQQQAVGSDLSSRWPGANNGHISSHHQQQKQLQQHLQQQQQSIQLLQAAASVAVSPRIQQYSQYQPQHQLQQQQQQQVQQYHHQQKSPSNSINNNTFSLNDTFNNNNNSNNFGISQQSQQHQQQQESSSLLLSEVFTNNGNDGLLHDFNFHF